MKQKILNYLQKIPYGKVATYKSIAEKFDVHPRKVAMTMKYNKNPEIFPCYKVIKTDLSLGGYSIDGGVDLKKKKLEAEGIKIVDGKVLEEFILS